MIRSSCAVHPMPGTTIRPEDEDCRNPRVLDTLTIRLPAESRNDIFARTWRVPPLARRRNCDICAPCTPERCGVCCRVALAYEQPFRKVMIVAWGFSSGNLIVDRRLGFAEGLAQDGELSAAIEVLRDALEMVPDWAAGWFRLAEWQEAAGNSPQAIAAWDRAVQADPSDALGAGLKRDLARQVPVAETMPAAFVEALFDQYAGDFDEALVDRLGYRAPGLLRAALAGRRFGRAMDLGCGTGLAGQAFRPACDWIEGVDISAGMLAQAQAKGVYDRLDKADLGALEIGDGRYDLILAADVFVYVGALERIVAWCAGSLSEGGVLGFTVEAAAESEGPLVLRESRRFAHSRDYLQGVLSAAGFARVRITPATLRRDRGVDIRGFVVLAEGVRVADRQGDGEGMALA